MNEIFSRFDRNSTSIISYPVPVFDFIVRINIAGIHQFKEKP